MSNSVLRSSRRRTGYALVLLTMVASGAAPAAAVLKPAVEAMEPVATDASIGAASAIANNWGGHQPRITQHADGRIRILYVAPRADGTLTWHLKVRSLAGVWSEEASGQTTDDVALLRDSRDDRAYVIAWPGSVPYAYASPAFVPFRIPGGWQVLPATARHYGNAGIAIDGTVCLKVSREANQLPLTSVSNTEYSCGIYAGASNSWSWGPLRARAIGQRHAYDYVFPKPTRGSTGVYGLQQRDAHKLAEKLPALGETYVFNGARTYSAKIDTVPQPALANSGVVVDPTKPAEYAQVEAVNKLPFANASITAAPSERMQDSYIDSKGRVFSIYALNDPANPATRTRNIVVTKLDGSPVATIAGMGVLPPPGQTRVVEDASSRLWLLWNNPGGKKTEVYVYPLTEKVAADGSSTFTVGAPTDLSAAFYPYVLDGPMYVAAVRGGSARSNYIHAVYNACTVAYVKDVNIDISTCYNKGNTGLQRVFYARIRLPD